MAEFLEESRRDWDARAVKDAWGYTGGLRGTTTEEQEARAKETAGAVIKRAGSFKRIVELGCGNGRLLPYYGGSVVGLDLSIEMLKQARERAGAGLVRIGGADMRMIRSASVDAVVAYAVFFHMPRTQFRRYAIEAARVLRPGGRFVFNLVYPYSFGRWVRAILALEPSSRATWHRRYYTPGQLRSIARGAGFEPIEVAREGTELWNTWVR